MTTRPQWYSPVCDMVLTKVTLWRRNYEKGEVHSTCKFHDPREGIVDKPTRYAHRIAWTKPEFDHLVRIMEEACPNKALVGELKTIRDEVLPKGQLVVGNARIVTMAFYPEHVDQILDTLKEARDGRQSTPADFQEEGRELFEV